MKKSVFLPEESLNWRDWFHVDRLDQLNFTILLAFDLLEVLKSHPSKLQPENL
jgi:hypothetical protein